MVEAATDLAVVADTDEYRFCVDGETLASAATRYLSTEVATGFTGVFLGPYATGHGTTCEADAVVERFVYDA